ncbi:LysM peptidoglycan-binding domain-containing protein [Haloferula chungangensis]|uniref:LysM peptidoglycan-binding domain-containing protein n=1 Tax=Haloferula chungangensis TaxID=1048331 RepID=A0ABW2L5W9_9BACT
MSLWMLIKIVAGLVVLGVVIFTAMLVKHVRQEPLGGAFSEWVPVNVDAKPLVALPEADSDLPEIDPGAKVFEKAREMIAIGDLQGARDKLQTVVSIYPRSKAAGEARRIVGEMNLDELLSAGRMTNKQVYTVKRGDSYLGIAGKFGTSLDMIMHLNGLMDLKSLQPNDELIVMPLNFRVLVEPHKKVLSLWNDGRFVREYLLSAVVGAPTRDLKTKIEGKSGVVGDRRVPPASPSYRGATKLLSIEKVSAVITAMPESGAESPDELPQGLYLAPADAEELSLLLRPGNEVEFRTSTR